MNGEAGISAVDEAIARLAIRELGPHWHGLPEPTAAESAAIMRLLSCGAIELKVDASISWSTATGVETWCGVYSICGFDPVNNLLRLAISDAGAPTIAGMVHGTNLFKARLTADGETFKKLAIRDRRSDSEISAVLRTVDDVEFRFVRFTHKAAGEFQKEASPSIVLRQAEVLGEIPPVATAESSKLPLNARMLAMLSSNPEAIGWSAQKFADVLGAAKSSIHNTAAWTTLMTTRSMQKADLLQKQHGDFGKKRRTK